MSGARPANSSLSLATGEAPAAAPELGTLDDRRPAGPDTEPREARDSRAAPPEARADAAYATAASMRFCIAFKPCAALREAPAVRSSALWTPTAHRCSRRELVGNIWHAAH